MKKQIKNTHLIHGAPMEWRVCTPAFLQELFNNNPKIGGVFYQPANIFRILLAQVAERASELNDPVMNALMCRLALYGIADPYDKENYDREALNKVLSHPEYLKYRKLKPDAEV